MSPLGEILENVFDKINSLRIRSDRESASPHKYILLLTFARLYEKNQSQQNRFYLNDELENAFLDTWNKYVPFDSKSTPLIEYPFYHLQRDDILFLKIKDEKTLTFKTYIESSRNRFTKRKLLETVEYAYLSEEFDTCLRNTLSREKFISSLINGILEIFKDKILLSDNNHSLFAHEEKAIQEIKNSIERHGLGYIIPNLFIHDAQTNRYLESDIVIVCRFGIYVTELKHWTGNIQIRPNTWLLNNSIFRKDPHILNSTKAKILRGIFERRFPYVSDLYIESVVVLTNPDAVVEGESLLTTSAHNPTLHGTDRLIGYLKAQRALKNEAMSQSQCKLATDFLVSLTQPKHTLGLQFPGYEVVKYLYQHTDRIEMVARSSDVRHQRLCRLRVFFPSANEALKDQGVFRERATATINAVAKVGDHPNILKVWHVPNDYGYIVEGSDWSEYGTLREMLQQSNPLDVERAVGIIRGILEGLRAIHAKDVIHRELCPENILMVEDIPRLTNFDFSYQLEEDRHTVIPDPDELKRSPYIAPEVYHGGSSLKEATDLFSVGVILFEMLTHSKPFGCSLDLEEIGGSLSFDAIQRLNNLPGHLSKLIQGLVQSDINKRPKNAEEVLSKLSVGASAIVSCSSNQLVAGETYKLYEIRNFIKKGIEAQLYEAKGPRGCEVVIKLFNIEVPLQRIMNEFDMARAVRHPAIVWADIYFRWSDDRTFIAFEKVNGPSLRSLIGKEKPSLDLFQSVAVTLLDALDEMHNFKDNDGVNPILHNDIKPENILLAEGSRPVLIDFGISSHPQVSLYGGTQGYVAPDLLDGTDRNYCISGDLYALGVTLYEWFFGRMPQQDKSDKENTSIGAGSPPKLISWFRRALDKDAASRFQSAEEMRDALLKTFKGSKGEKEKCVQSRDVSISRGLMGEEQAVEMPPEEEPGLERVCFKLEEGQPPNSFVRYLNSLHSRDASSENAIAESQALNALFSHIHVPHPITEKITEILLGTTRRHVILTGHAGDGKSTIGLEVYKKMKGEPLDKPISRHLKRREDVNNDQIQLALIKDLSEWSKDERQALLEEMLRQDGPRFLLITNTGTLLDTFRENAQRSNGETRAIENLILKAISEEDFHDLQFNGSDFAVINIALMDNLHIAEQIFERMICEDRWSACKGKECRTMCPIYRNITVIKGNEPIVRDRLFMAYRRMYEYGTRLTLRQLTAHFAYMITSGLEYDDIVDLSSRAEKPLMTEFMFFNRFFGDNGKKDDYPAFQLRAVREIRHQGFGELPCPTWERRLWLKTRGQSFRINADQCEVELDRLRLIGARFTYDEAILNAQARKQVRRMLYFLHRFDHDGDAFVRNFLRSSAILDCIKWQAPSYRLALLEKNALKRKIFHVLQEQFTGVRLPEGSQSDRTLYVTLSRRKHEVRQSAQVVLARFDSERDFDLELETKDTGTGNRRVILVLKGRGAIENIRLDLTLPFLDYVMMRNQGEVGEMLQAAFVDRLERFKAQLLKASRRSFGEDIMLVRLKTNHTFRRQVYVVHDNYLEVSDA